jgi:hypothetical protein
MEWLQGETGNSPALCTAVTLFAAIRGDGDPSPCDSATARGLDGCDFLTFGRAFGIECLSPARAPRTYKCRHASW